jgi:hypothetical protein
MPLNEGPASGYVARSARALTAQGGNDDIAGELPIYGIQRGANRILDTGNASRDSWDGSSSLYPCRCPSQPGVTLGVIDASDRPYCAGRAGQWLLPPPELLKLRCAPAAAYATVTGPTSWSSSAPERPSRTGGSWNEQAPRPLIRHRWEPRHEPVRAGKPASRRTMGARPGPPREQLGWLLGSLGYHQFQDWEHGRGRSWLSAAATSLSSSHPP